MRGKDQTTCGKKRYGLALLVLLAFAVGFAVGLFGFVFSSNTAHGIEDNEQSFEESQGVCELRSEIDNLNSQLGDTLGRVEFLENQVSELSLSTVEEVGEENIVDEAESLPSDSIGEFSVENVIANSSIVIAGNDISYIDAYMAESAPRGCAGLWAGCDSTTDGSWGFFVGHTPGVFSDVLDVELGDEVYIKDSAGDGATYIVVNVFDVAPTAYLEDIYPEFCNLGECCVLQTCTYSDTYRIVIGVVE